MPVSGETLDLVDIKVTGYDPFDIKEESGGAYGEVNIQTITDVGVTEASYVWNDFIEIDYDGEGNNRTWYGWFADGEEEAAKRGELIFAPGEGFLLICESYDFPFALQSAGQVLTVADQEVDLQLHEKLVSNPTPVTVDLTACYVGGYDPFVIETEAGGAYGEVNVQKITDVGVTEESYVWNDFIEIDYDGEGNNRTWYGWYADGEEEPISKGTSTVAAGEGLLVICESFDYDYTFVWPKVDVK